MPSGFWKNSIAKFNTATGFAEDILLDDQGQTLIGVHVLRITKISVKPTSQVKTTGALCCSVYTSYKQTSEGPVKKQYIPIDIFTLAGPKDQVIIIPITNDLIIQFSDISNISFWLEDLNKKKLGNVQLDVLFSHQKSVNNP